MDLEREWWKGRREGNVLIPFADYVQLVRSVSEAAKNYDFDSSVIDYIQRLEHNGFTPEKGVLSFREMDWPRMDIR